MHKLLKTFIDYPGVKRYGQNVGWLFLEKGFRMVLTLFVGIWMVRYQGPTQFGLLSYAQSIAIILIAISGFGLESILIKELVHDKDKRHQLLGTAIILRLIVALIIIAILAVMLLFKMQVSQTELLIFIITLSTLFSSFDVISRYFEANVQSKYIVFANMAAFSMISLLKILLILFEASVTAFAITNLIEYVLIAVFLVYFCQKTSASNLFSWRFDFSIARLLIVYTWPLAVVTTFTVLLNNINQIMIKAFLTTDAV
jgi:O-antigen/teichoic acid export membrane protein